MSTLTVPVRRAPLFSAAVSVTMLAAAQAFAVVSFDLPQVQVTAPTSGPTTGSFSVLVHAAPADLPKSIGSLNVDFSVSNLLVSLTSPKIPTVNPLLTDPGTAENPFFFNGSPNAQTIRWAHDVPTDQPLMDGKSLVTVNFSVPAGLTGTFPLSFGAVAFNTLVDSTAKPVPINITDVGSITVMSPAVGVPGDYNSNGVVDAADYVRWRDRNGTTFTLPNEVSGVTPGLVTVEDYNAWRARFGRTSGAGAVAFATSAVPEPAAGILISSIVLLAALRRAR